jgi:purine-binding chemotaxis protein CheW
VAGKQFAVDLARVERILDYRRPTRTPRRPPHVEGIIQHEGRYLPIMSLRKRLGVEGPGPANPAILLLTGIGRDPVVGVVADRLLLPPPRVFGIRAEFIRGVANAGGRPVVWLDESKLLTSAEAITLLA